MRERTIHRRTTHGASYTPEYDIWSGMKARCHTKSHKQYADYGGRGIRVCEGWRASFAAFLRDMGPRPTTEHSLDRIDNDRGYEPGNVRWATDVDQTNNQRTNRKLTHNGETHTLAEWGKRLGIRAGAIQLRLHRGWSVEEALTVRLGSVYARRPKNHVTAPSAPAPPSS
jgi:hypothetical protein